MKIASIRYGRKQLESNKPMVRYPFTEQDEKNRVKFDPTQHFRFNEVSTHLEVRFQGEKWIDVRTTDPSYLERIERFGYVLGNQRFTVVFAYWRENEGMAIAVPEDSQFARLEDLGIVTFMTNISESLKVGKYVNRLIVPCANVIFGEELDWNEDEQSSLIKLDRPDLDEEAATLSVRYVTLKELDRLQVALTDGFIAFSEKAKKALRLKGVAWRVTVGTPHGLGKGHSAVIPNLDHDIVIYGPKTLVRTAYFYFGEMLELHSTLPHTDSQAFVNFGFHRPEMGPALARKFRYEVLAAAKNERKMRKLVLQYAKSNRDPWDPEGWLLQRLMTYASYLRFPGAFRRVVRHLMHQVMDLEERARIPMMGVARTGYVMPDPHVIDSEGDVHPELSKIGPGEICVPDLPAGTEVACYRQPSENPNAHVILRNVIPDSSFRKYKGRGLCFLGQGATVTLGRLGGGDMDDSLVIVYDPVWVNGFKTLTPYPETPKLQDLPEAGELLYPDDPEYLDMAGQEEFLPSTYSHRHFAHQIEQANRSRAGIGTVVNAVMIDTLLSQEDHKASMISDLESRGLMEYADWLREREPYQLATLASNLERVIDGSVKDVSLLAPLGDVAATIKAFHDGVMVYPAAMSTPLSKKDRIPASRASRGGYVLANSLYCRALLQMAEKREVLMHIFHDLEWLMVGPPAIEVVQYYPTSDAVRTIVNGNRKTGDPGLKGIWRKTWEEIHARGWVDEDYQRASDLIAKELSIYSDEEKDSIVAYLYKSTYRREQIVSRTLPGGGRRDIYPDSLLWTNAIGNVLIDLWRKVRRSDDPTRPLAGFMEAIDIDPYWTEYLNGVVPVKVNPEPVIMPVTGDKQRVVYHAVTGEHIGMVKRTPGGTYRMVDGMIIYRRPAPDLLPIVPEWADPLDLVPTEVPAVPEVAPAPTGANAEQEEASYITSFGKQLKDALKKKLNQ